jgi:hypothetical protein
MKLMKPDIEPVLLWCKQELVSVWQRLELLEAGKIGTYEREGSTSIDTTAQTIEQLKMKFSTLEALVAEAQSTNEAPQGEAARMRARAVRTDSGPAQSGTNQVAIGP